MVDDQRKWYTIERDIERLLNTAVNKTASKTPYEALHGYRPRYVSSALSTLSRTKDDWLDPVKQQQQVRQTILKQQEAMKERYNGRHHDGIHFDFGEIVVMLRQPVSCEPSKLQSKYREKPLQVIEKLPSDTYRVDGVAADG